MALVKQTSTISASAIFLPLFLWQYMGHKMAYHTFHQPRLIPVKLRIVHLILKLLRITAQIQELPVIMSVFLHMDIFAAAIGYCAEALGFAEGIRQIFRSLLQRPAVTRNRLRAPGRQARREDIRQIDHPPADSRLTLSRETHQQWDPPYIIIRTIMFPPDTMVSQHFSMIGGKNHKRIFRHNVFFTASNIFPTSSSISAILA